MKYYDDYLLYLRNEKHPQIRSIQSQGGVLLPIKMAKMIHAAAATKWPLQHLSSREVSAGLKTKVVHKISDVILNWLAEGQVYNETDIELGGFIADLHKVVATIKVSEELLNDSFFDIENFLAKYFGEGLAGELENIFICGDGAKKPRGFLMDCQKMPSLKSDIDFNDLLNLFNTLNANFFNSANWLFNKETFAIITQLKDNSDKLVFKPYETKTPTDPVGYLFSKACYVSLLPEENPIAFGDFSYYKVIEKLPVVQRLNELYAEKGIIGFIMRNFIDAKLLKSEAIIALECA
jgi:HK97 family phage major capsid protein